MKNKKNLLLLAVALVLGGATFGYFQYKRNTNLNGYDYEFAVKDTASIYKIFLADRQGRKITLTRESTSEWKLNGMYRARKDAVDNLLNTIGRVDLMYRLPRNAVKNVVKDIASEGRKVEIYDKNNKRLKSYYVGGSDADGYGTNMMLDGSNEPYVTHIPSFVGNLRVRYFTEVLDWRDRYLFRLSPEDIQAVSVDYPLQKSKSFKLERDEKDAKDFKITPFYDITPKISRPMTKGLVESYLLGFKKLGIEGFENGHPQTDSIKAALPFAIVTLKTVKGEERILKFHPIIPKSVGGALLVSYDGKTTVERYYLEDSNGDLDMVQHGLFEKIFWAYEGFFVRPRG
jgi:Domain of unknown function (DUF4340)